MKSLLLTLATLFVAGSLGFATDDKPADTKDMPYTGTWERDTEQGLNLAFSFKTKDTFILTATAGPAKLKATCKYKFDKETGIIKAEFTKIEAEDDFPEVPEKGDKFAFKLVVAKDKESAKLTDYDAPNADTVRDIIEGEYKPKKAD